MSQYLRLILLTLAIFVIDVVSVHAQIYTVTDLGTNVGNAVNDAGQITGYTTGNSSVLPEHAFFLASSTNLAQLTDLGTLGGNSIGYSINANAAIAGTYNDNSHVNNSVDSDAHPCYWPNPTTTAIALSSLVDYGTLTINTGNTEPLNVASDVRNYSYTQSINNAGMIAGLGDTITYTPVGTDSTTGLEYGIWEAGPAHGCLWQPGSQYPQDLGSLDYNDNFEDVGNSYAYGINNANRIVGETDTYLLDANGNPISHACYWDAGSSIPVDIDQVSTGSEANSINDNGQITGYRVTNGGATACVWSPNSGGTWDVQDINAPAPYNASAGGSINNAGQVVGNCYTVTGLPNITVSGFHPFLWSPGDKQMKDLNTLIDPNSGWTLTEATCISNTGYITGVGTYEGVPHTFVLKPVLWGARVQLTRANPTQTINDYLVSFENRQVTLLSGLSFNTTGQIIADEKAKISVDDIISIQVLPDHPDTQNPADIPSEAGFNKYLITPGVGKGMPTPKYSAKNVVELGQLVGDSIPSPNIGFSNGNWNTIFYQFPGHYSRYPKPFSKDAGYSFYAIPRVPGATSYQNIYADLTDAASSLHLSALGIQKNRAIPRQVLYGIAWQESPDPYDPNPIAKGNGWNQFGYITYYKNKKAVYDYDSKYGSTNYTMVTVDGGIGIMQITGGIAFDLATKVPLPDGLDTLSSQLTVLYGISGEPAYNIQAGAYLLDENWATAPSLFKNNASPEFLDHWYYAVGSYNGSGQSYVESVWNWIRTAPYQSVLPGINDPGLNPVLLPTATSNAMFGDFDLDGQVDIMLSNFQRGRSIKGQTPISVQLTPLHPGFVVTQAVATVQTGKQTSSQINLIDDGSGLWTGNIPSTLASTAKYYFFLDITGGGLTKRAVLYK